MARNRPNNLHAVKNLAEASATLAEIAGVKRDLKAIEGRLNAEIDHLKAQAEIEASPIQVKLKQLEAGLQAFAEYNRDLFKDRRSRELDFGTIGFRKSKEIKPQPKMT